MTEPLDDIVFEKRNKEYGAFDLRKRYPALLFRSTVFGSLGVILFFAGVLMQSQLKDRPRVSAGEIFAAYELMNLDMDQDMLPPPDVPLQKSAEETILPKVSVEETPLVVKEKTELNPEEKKKQDLLDSTAKTGDHLKIKGSGTDGADSGAVYIRVERFPEFPGGKAALDRFLRDNIRYPREAMEKKLAGIVHISFIINQFGRVEGVRVSRSLDPLLDNEAVRVVQMMPAWSPGRRHGQPVKVLLTLPIRFMPNN